MLHIYGGEGGRIRTHGYGGELHGTKRKEYPKDQRRRGGQGAIRMADTKYPLRTLGGVTFGRAQPSWKVSDPTENCCPTRPTSKKTLPLHS